MTLSDRDLRLLEYIKDQGYVTYQQAYESFFEHKSDFSRRLKQLSMAGALEIKPLKDYFDLSSQSQYFPYILPLGVKKNTQVLTLSKRLRRLYPNYDTIFKKDILLHQLYVGKIRNHYAKKIENSLVLSEYELHTFSRHLVDMNRDIHPDLAFKKDEVNLAVEMERTTKSFDRYFTKFVHFHDSCYSHVLYVFPDQKSLVSVMKLARIYRKIGFALITNLNEVHSPLYGKLLFEDWLERPKIDLCDSHKVD